MNSTVFIVDNDPSVRESLSLLLKATGHQPESFADAQSFLDEFDADRPGCLILDVRMPGMDGLQLQRLLADRAPHLPVIMLTAHGDLPMAVDSMRSGAWHFVEKPYDKDRLLGIVDEALESDLEFRRENAERLEIEQRLGTLTEREREVADQLADGKSTKLVATALGTSPNTIAHQRAKILAKMQAESVADLTRMLMLARDE
ncbi:MAG: response regulator [Planctomycetota bacterium]|nr:response regulator [Planctomycetota bacterium]MDA1251763.1 response regulator [Planctomycetota bacterium]